MSTEEPQQQVEAIKVIETRPQVDLKKTIFKNLIIGGTAGIIGSLSTYPLDMVKTQMQNQRSGQQRLYDNSLDCAIKLFKNGGITKGLYRGITSQLIGITPEKAIKLTVNDTVRHFFKQEDGSVTIFGAVLAGSLAGTSQVVATNPYEIVKVRLQTQSSHEAKSAFQIIQQLGFQGLFRGAPATLLRDVPFSAVYFSLFGYTSYLLRDENGKVSFWKNFLAGVGSGMCSAAAVTPADVIKTRIQVADSKHTGIVDCATHIMKNEGISAFFKGTLPRVMIISPLFGITLSVYEALKDFFG